MITHPTDLAALRMKSAHNPAHIRNESRVEPFRGRAIASPPMTDVRHTAGQQGEDHAAQHFERLGFDILARNHRTRFGELDLVVYDGDDARLRRGQDPPLRRARAVGEPPRPQAVQGPPDGGRLAHRVPDRPFGAALRFDGVAVLLDADGDLVRLDHLEAAF